MAASNSSTNAYDVIGACMIGGVLLCGLIRTIEAVRLNRIVEDSWREEVEARRRYEAQQLLQLDQQKQTPAANQTPALAK